MTYLDLTSEELHSVLIYDAEDGSLYWRERSVSMFADGPHQLACSKAATWNKKHAGKLALTAVGSHGYRCGDVLGFHVLAHRVIFCMAYGHWPVMTDHISGNRLDNRLDNIREIFSDEENSMNRAIPSHNKSGFIGISWDRDCGKWRVHAKKKYIGVFDDYADAVAARTMANEKFGFHQNHGRVS